MVSMLSMSTVPAAPPDAGLEEFSAAIEQFARAQRRVAGRFNRAPAVPELSKAQYLLLAPLLSAEDTLSVGDLAEAAGVSAPTATRMLDGLTERGIVTRAGGARDRRVVLIGLTDHGRELMDAKHERVLAARAAVYAQLTPAERRGAARLLTRLARAIEELHP
ncbi:MAG: MarR family transcriptional regulator [Solirubrobacterales bacterium]|nr:MarR family transcriptional regulator [Solirubrobacterales bacterium]